MVSTVYSRFPIWTFLTSKISVKLSLIFILAPRILSTLRITPKTPEVTSASRVSMSKSIITFFQASKSFLRSGAQSWVREAWKTLFPRPEQRFTRSLRSPHSESANLLNVRSTTPVSAIRIELFLQRNLQRVISNRNQRTSSNAGLLSPQKMKFIDAPSVPASSLMDFSRKTLGSYPSIIVTATS